MEHRSDDVRSPSRGLWRIAAILIVVPALFPQALDAQRIRGTVHDAATGAPIAGAVVSAATASDSLVARTITDNLGSFALAVGGLRSMRVRVVRLGYQPQLVAHEFADSSAIDVKLVGIALGLAPVQAESRRDCPERKDAAAAAELWTQAQSALLAGIVARDANPAVMRVVRFHREMTTVPMAPIFEQTVRTLAGVATRVMATAQTPRFLEDHGYIASQPRGDAVVMPYEEVLIDGSFARTHCFGIDRDRDQHPGELGITFAPTKARDALTDVEGTLWVDSTRAQLRRLLFTYTHFPGRAVRGNQAGGSITFATSANGIPLVVAWLQRGPPAALVGAFPESTSSGYGHRVGQVFRPVPEDGGELVRATWADGTTWVDSLGRMNGIVRDLSSHQPRSNVPIRLVNAARAVRTDSLGQFAFDELLPGPYVLAVDDTVLSLFREVVGGDEPRFSGARPAQTMRDWLTRLNVGSIPGAQPQVQTIGIDRGQNPDITIEIPALDKAFRNRCGRALDGDSAGIAAIWALRGDTPADGATIRARWTSGGADVIRSVRTDDEGRAMVCGIPHGSAVTLSTAIDGKTFGSATTLRIYDALVTFTVLRVAMP